MQMMARLVCSKVRIWFAPKTSSTIAFYDDRGLDIPALIVPGHDASHATSAARYLEECLPRAEYWDVPVDGQTEDTVPARLLAFLDRH